MERIEWFDEDFNPLAFFLLFLLPVFAFLGIVALLLIGIFLLVTSFGAPALSSFGGFLGCGGIVILVLAVAAIALAVVFGKKGNYRYGISDEGITITQRMPLDPLHEWPVKIRYGDIDSIELIPQGELHRLLKEPMKFRVTVPLISMGLFDIALSGGNADVLLVRLKEGKLAYYKRAVVLGDKSQIRLTFAIKPKDMGGFVSKAKGHLGQ